VAGTGACALLQPEESPISTDTPPPAAQPSSTAATAPPDPTSSTTPSPQPTEEDHRAQIAFVKTTDRADGVRRALDLLGINPADGKNVILKPNFNSADSPPGSTHNDVLRTLVASLW
jgi:hypothetical protein